MILTVLPNCSTKSQSNNYCIDKLSGLFPIWLKRFGFLSAIYDKERDINNLKIVGPGQIKRCNVSKMSCCIIEAENNTSYLTANGVVATPMTCSAIQLSRSTSLEGVFGAGVDFADGRNYIPRGFRAIRTAPRQARAGEKIDVKPARGPTPATLKLHKLTAPNNDWVPIVWAFPDKEKKPIPIAIRRNDIVIFGIQLTALLGARQTLFSLPNAYFDEEIAALPWSFEVWLRDIILDIASSSGAIVVRHDLWPNNYKSSFTLRHDYDRAISNSHFDRLLSVYRELGIRCSIGYLKRLLPTSQAKLLVSAGHEATLHSEACNLEDFTEEVKNHSQVVGVYPSGVTFHGGTGAFGIRGSHNFNWAERLNLLYCESYLKTAAFHTATLLQDDCWRVAKPISIPFHLSFDAAHYLPDLSIEITADLVKRMVKAGQHVTLMNHPDLFSASLFAFLRSIDFSDVWCATHSEIAIWSKSLLDISVKSINSGNAFDVSLTRPLQHNLGITIHVGKEANRYTLKAGNSSLRIQKSQSF